MKLSAHSLFVLVTLSAACGGRGGSAATLPNGAKVAVMVFFDRGISADMPPEKVNQMNEVGSWMENDLLTILQKTGYDAALVQNKDMATEVGRYLLRMSIVEYNGGSKAARMFVGWGAGSARLSVHYELVGANGTVYIMASPNAATGRADWQHVARKIDLDTVDAVNNRLRRSL